MSESLNLVGIYAHINLDIGHAEKKIYHGNVLSNTVASTERAQEVEILVITPMYPEVGLEYVLANTAQFWNSLQSIVHVDPTLKHK